jgi:hypothetical protein
MRRAGWAPRMRVVAEMIEEEGMDRIGRGMAEVEAAEEIEEDAGVIRMMIINMNYEI